MKKVNIGINGFGRIGRTLFRLLNEHPHLNVVAINDLANARTLSHLLKYDSIHGVWSNEISHDTENIIVKGKKIHLSNAISPQNIPWSDHKLDIVIECSGKFKTRETLQHHLNNGAKKGYTFGSPTRRDYKNDRIWGQ